MLPRAFMFYIHCAFDFNSLLIMSNAQLSETDENNPEALALFQSIWREIEASLGVENLIFPKEISWLNGAPGAGKGTQTNVILASLKYSSAPIVMSDLLQTPQMRAIKASGGLVGDKEVISLLFHRLVLPDFREGVLVDGFPRTATQVACLKLLKKKLDALHAQRPEKFPATNFNILMLFVTEHESVERQLKRGREMKAQGLEVRETDLDPEKTRTRYRVFEEMTLRPVESLKGVFPYFHIDSLGTIEEISAHIRKMLSAAR